MGDIDGVDGGPNEARVPVLIIPGPPGAGKTTIAFAVSDRPQGAGSPHAVVDLDALGWCYPRPEDDPFHMDLRLTNLSAVWANHHAAGARRLVVATVVETADDASGTRMRWVPLSRWSSGCADSDTLHARLQ